MGIDIRTLGTLSVTRDGAPLSQLPGQRLRMAVLVYLAVEQERGRDSLIGVFWPDREQAKARHALTQTLLELRKVLGDNWLRTSGDLLRTSDSVSVDVLRFEDAVKQGPSSALNLYGGAFLEGMYLADTHEFQSWVDGVRGSAERCFRDSVRAAIEGAVGSGDVDGAVKGAEQWVKHMPFEDEAHYSLIALLAQVGRRGDAVRRFEAYKRQLDDEGWAPVRRLVALMDDIRAGRIEAPYGVVTTWPRGLGLSGLRSGQVDRTTPLGGGPATGPRLVRITESGDSAEVYSIRSPHTVMGRLDGDHRFPEDSHMSATHAKLSIRRDTGDRFRVFIRDAGSRNGVFVKVRDSWPLVDGDEFAVGKQVFRFVHPRQHTAPIADSGDTGTSGDEGRADDSP